MRPRVPPPQGIRRSVPTARPPSVNPSDLLSEQPISVPERPPLAVAAKPAPTVSVPAVLEISTPVAAAKPAPTLTTKKKVGRSRKTLNEQEIRMLENAGELVQVGTAIVGLSESLHAARAERDAAQAKVNELEAKLRPLLVQHASLMAQITGAVPAQAQQWPPGVPMYPQPMYPPQPVPMMPPGAPQMPPQMPPQQLPPASPATDPLRNRVKDYLRTRGGGEDTLSPLDVAEVLHVDAALVREVMREMRTGR